jgi:hypothetical protein
MKLVIPQAVIVHNATAQMKDGKPIFWARVQFMGGEIRTQNPKKFSGPAQDVEIAVTPRASAKAFHNKDTHQTSGFIALEIQGDEITSAKGAKVAA